MTTAIDYIKERTKDVEAIKSSAHPKRVVLAGPGTGKSFLFEEILKKKRTEGKNKFLAITFMGKLSDELADKLAGLAETYTLHGFAWKVMRENSPEGWKYYTKIKDIIFHDLKVSGAKKSVIGDKEYISRTKYYKALGHDDVVYYASKFLAENEDKIPKYELILIDEFQDFNEFESEFIDLLAKKNEILIVGDDDQALYTFRGSSPKYIRSKWDSSNSEYESHTLRFCSRCTEVIVKSFHNIVSHYGLSEEKTGRKDKDYIYFPPEKDADSGLNKMLMLLPNKGLGEIAPKIKTELESILQIQKVKSVLVLGEAKSSRSTLDFIAKKLKQYGFSNVDNKINPDKPIIFNQEIIDGYKLINDGDNYILAWRILAINIKGMDLDNSLKDNYNDPEKFIESIPENERKIHEKRAHTLNKVLNETESKVKTIADSTMNELSDAITIKEKSQRELLVGQLLEENKNLSRPLANLDITVCTIMGSKGLGADVVFLVGFDQGKFPVKEKPKDSEIYQLLVALTRAKKRIYLINTKDKKISCFVEAIGKDQIELI